MEHLVIKNENAEFDVLVRDLTKHMGRAPDGMLPAHGLIGFKCENRVEADGCAKRLSQSVAGISVLIETYNGPPTAPEAEPQFIPAVVMEPVTIRKGRGRR